MDTFKYPVAYENVDSFLYDYNSLLELECFNGMTVIYK